MQALASSTPDDNHMLMRMVRMLVEPKQTHHWSHALIASALGSIVILIYVIAKWGVPAILAAQNLILQLHGDDLKDRQSERQIAVDQVSATKALQASVEQMAASIGTKLDAQGRRIDGLSGDVRALQANQAQADRKINAVAAEQARLRRRE